MGLITILLLSCLLGDIHPGKDVSACLDSLAQNNEKYVSKLQKKAKKLFCFEKGESYKAFFIFYLSLEGVPEKDLFTNRDTLFHHLNIVKTRDSGFPDNMALLRNSKGEIKFSFSNMRGFCAGGVKSQDELVMDYAFKNGADYAFHVLGSNISVFFVEVNNAIKVIDLRDGKMDVWDMEDYIQCCWDSLFP